MKIGTIQAQPGAKTYGCFKTGETHGGYPVQIPLHIINGAEDGPTLVVQAGASGLEIEPALILPTVVKQLDPAQIRGTVVIAPLLNTSGFEFEQVNSVWDDKHLNRIGRGAADGTVNEQLIHAYYQAAIAQADALLDFRSGALWSYHQFAAVYDGDAAEKSKALAVALGLPQVLLGHEADNSMAEAAAQDGIATAVAYIGGCPGLRDYRALILGRIQGAVLNAMRQLDMLDGALESDCEKVAVLRQHSVIRPRGARGLTFMDKSLRGQAVDAGAALGYVRHAFSGEMLEEIRAPRAGVVVDGGAAWPVPAEDTVLAILGDLVEEVGLG